MSAAASVGVFCVCRHLHVVVDCVVLGRSEQRVCHFHDQGLGHEHEEVRSHEPDQRPGAFSRPCVSLAATLGAVSDASCCGRVAVQGTFMASKLALPYLLKSKFTPHILTLSPPLNLDPRWLALTGTAYTMGA